MLVSQETRSNEITRCYHSLASLAPANGGSRARGDGAIKETLASSTKDTSLLLQFKVDYTAIQANGDYLRVNPWQTRKANDH